MWLHQSPSFTFTFFFVQPLYYVSWWPSQENKQKTVFDRAWLFIHLFSHHTDWHIVGQLPIIRRDLTSCPTETFTWDSKNIINEWTQNCLIVSYAPNKALVGSLKRTYTHTSPYKTVSVTFTNLQSNKPPCFGSNCQDEVSKHGKVCSVWAPIASSFSFLSFCFQTWATPWIVLKRVHAKAFHYLIHSPLWRVCGQSASSVLNPVFVFGWCVSCLYKTSISVVNPNYS